LKANPSTVKQSRGRWLVVIIVTLGIAGALVAPWLRSVSKPRHIAQLDEGNVARMAGFYGLLKANLLWTYARNYVFDLRDDAYGAAYVRHLGSKGDPKLVIRGTPERLNLPKLSNLFVFSATGDFETIHERAAAFIVGWPHTATTDDSRSKETLPPHGVVAVVQAQRDSKRCRLFLLDAETKPFLLTTPFRLRIASGASVLVEWPAERPEPLIREVQLKPDQAVPSYRLNQSTTQIELVKG